MTRLDHEARLQGVHQACLLVHPDNVAARRLSESLGYRSAREERSDLIMALDLGEEPLDVGRRS